MQTTDDILIDFYNDWYFYQNYYNKEKKNKKAFLIKFE